MIMKPEFYSMRRSLSIFLLFMTFSACGSLPRVIVLKDPLSAQEHLQLGATYEREEQWSLALSEYRAAIEKGADRALLEGYIGNIYFGMGDYGKSEAAYRRALKSKPENPPILNNLASVYVAEKRNLDEAERLVRSAMAADPTRLPYYLDTLGSIYRVRGDTDMAWVLFQEAEARMPAHTDAAAELSKNRRQAQALMEAEGDTQREGETGLAR